MLASIRSVFENGNTNSYTATDTNSKSDSKKSRIRVHVFVFNEKFQSGSNSLEIIRSKIPRQFLDAGYEIVFAD